jgi:membrane protein implicated in regulation of membrane protease activity
MSKILTFITVLLIIAIVATNSFIVFSPDEGSRSYFSNLTTTLTVAAPMVIAFVMVFRYKRGLRKQEDNKPQGHSQQHILNNLIYDNNKMHLSICIFLILWFTAHVIWTFQYQQSSDVSIQDVLWFIGYGFFGYFLYSLYYYFFRKEFEPMVLVSIAIVIVIVLIFIIDVIVSTLRLLSTQPIDISLLLVTVAYPTLDAVMIFPAVLILWAVRRVSNRRMDTTPEKNKEIETEEDKSAFSNTGAPSIWILLLLYQ